MSLLENLKSRDDGVQRQRYPGIVWRPAKDKSHPAGVEGRIEDIHVQARREIKVGGPTEDFVLIVHNEVGEPWCVYGSPRDLNSKLAVLHEQGLLEIGKTIAIAFLGEFREVARDGTPYTFYGYAVAAEPAS